MSFSTIRRQVKNVAYNFSDAQVKVREATSDDPCGPSTTLMSEIAELTHQTIPFTEIMFMLWKRLNDHGKNWRYTYKSLVLLDYLIRCGSEKIAHQCRENIHSIEALRDSQHVEENIDQCMNVREKAKQMVSLLYDEERLKKERTKFMMTRKKFMTGSAISSVGAVRPMRKSDTVELSESEMDDARPSSAGEEEMQLQIALALSKEENDKEDEIRKKDDIGLQLAIHESRREVEWLGSLDSATQHTVSGATLSQSAVDDLLSLGVGEPVILDQTTPYNPWGGPVADPWAPSPSTLQATGTATATATTDTSSMCPSLSFGHPSNNPWAPSSTDSLGTTTTTTAAPMLDSWAPVSSLEPIRAPLQPTMGLGLGSNGLGLGSNITQNDMNARQRLNTNTPESFLGENSALVNLDNLMGTPSTAVNPANNPFLSNGAAQPMVSNSLAAKQRPSRTLNEMLNNRDATTTSAMSASNSQSRMGGMQQTSMDGGAMRDGLQMMGGAMGDGIPLQPQIVSSQQQSSGQQVTPLTNPFLL